jgi:hypothetical protein
MSVSQVRVVTVDCALTCGQPSTAPAYLALRGGCARRNGTSATAGPASTRPNARTKVFKPVPRLLVLKRGKKMLSFDKHKIAPFYPLFFKNEQ